LPSLLLTAALAAMQEFLDMPAPSFSSHPSAVGPQEPPSVVARPEPPWKRARRFKAENVPATDALAVAQRQAMAGNWTRANASRSPATRKELRQTCWQELKILRDADANAWDDNEKAMAMEARAPWDIRGPPGPDDGGPTVWRGQDFREGSQRFANRGGSNKKKWAVYLSKKRDGKTGKDLHFYHPKNIDGHWKAVPDPDA
jgi:hypothetical protein